MQIGILIPKRPEFGNAYWCLQRKFDSGFHVVDVTEAQLAELKADPVAQVVEGDAMKAHMAPAVSKPEAAAEAPVAEEKPGKPMKR